jgi:hypothetical protein
MRFDQQQCDPQEVVEDVEARLIIFSASWQQRPGGRSQVQG